MNKKVTYLTAFFVLMCSYGIWAQSIIPLYTFSQSSGSYTKYSSGSVVASGTGLNSQTYKLKLPFAINIDNVYYDSAYISVNGYVAFGGDPGSVHWGIANASSGIAIVAGFSADLASYNSGTELRQITLGSAPNRTWLVQWTDFGYPSSSQLKTSFQVWFSENDGEIKVVYDATTVTGGSLSTQVGLRGTSTSNFFHRRNSWSSSSAATTSTQSITTTSSNKPSNGLTFKFKPPACTAPAAQPTNLSVTASYTSANGSFTAASPVADKYLVVRAPATGLNTMPTDGVVYSTNGALGNGTVVYSGKNTSFSSSGLTQNTDYIFYVFSYNDTCYAGPDYKTTNPATDTINTRGARKYIWQPTSGSVNWATPTNWIPVRNYFESNDTLLFNKGGNVVITNYSTNTPSSIISLTNNTSITFTGTIPRDLRLYHELYVEAGSKLTLDSSINLSFLSGSPVATINGTLTIRDSATYDAKNSVTKVNGEVYVSGTAQFTTSCTGICSDIFFNAGSKYQHDRDGGILPKAIFDSTSTVEITGIITTKPTASVDTLGNLVWRCAGQTAIIQLHNFFIKGNMTVDSTGSSAIKYDNTILTVFNVAKDYIQTGGTIHMKPYVGRMNVYGDMYLQGGTLDLNYDGFYNDAVLYLGGHLIQSSAHTITKTASSMPGINFSGRYYNQLVSLYGTFNVNKITIGLDNAYGATLTGNLPMGNESSNTITAGRWTGSGKFIYSGNTTLKYELRDNRTATDVEWPSSNSPRNVIVNFASNYPDNKLRMPGTRTIKGYFLLYNAILELQDKDLILDTNGSVTINGSVVPITDSTSFVAADSTGKLIAFVQARASTSSPKNYFFPVGDLKGTPTYAPAYLKIYTNATDRYIGVNTRNIQHPNDNSVTDYVKRYWTFTDDGGSAAYTYNLELYHMFSDLVGKQNFRINSWDGSAWKQFPSWCFNTDFTNNYQSQLAGVVTDSIISSADYQLGNRDIALRTTVNKVYSWTGAVNKNYQNPLNWTPNRTVPDPADILQFNSGNTDTIENIITGNIAALRFTNNTTAHLRANSGYSAGVSLVLNSDFDSTKHELLVDSGSACYLDGTLSPLHIKYYGVYNGFNQPVTNATGHIAGRFEVANSVVFNKIILDNAVTTVTESGTAATSADNYITSDNEFDKTSSTNFIIYGNFENKHANYGGFIPRATWKDGANLKFIGYKANTYLYFPPGSYYNVIYNCPNQTSKVVGNVANIDSIRGTLKIVSTGTDTLSLSNTFGNFDVYANNYLQTGGIIDLNSYSSLNYTKRLNFSGKFVQSGGTFFATSGNPILNFNGNVGRQDVTFKTSMPAGPVHYQVSNANGIKIQDSLLTATNFDVNTGGGINIAAATSAPILTTKKIVYASNTILSYTGKGVYNSDTLVFPATNGPDNLLLQADDTSLITLPGSRTISGKLTMKGGDFAIGNDTLTLGASAADSGTLVYQGGFIRIAKGALKRWMGTKSLPTSPGTNIGFYPLADMDGNNRSAAIYFSSSTGISTGGTIKVSHNDVNTITTGLSVTDGSYTINNRTDAYWDFAPANGLAVTSTMGTRVTAAGLFNAQSIPNLRLMKAASVVGNHINGSGSFPDVMVQRTGINFTDFTSSPFYVGADSLFLDKVFISVKNGDWGNPSTWDVAAVPTFDDEVHIRTGDTVTVDTASFAERVNVSSKAMLVVPDSMLKVRYQVVNNGSINIGGGTIYAGKVGGGGGGRMINYGRLSVTSGNLVVNGGMSLESNSYFKQSGGHITLDPNANGVKDSSFNGNTLDIRTDNLEVTAGDITIVDPPVSLGSSFYYSTPTSSPGSSFGEGHTIYFGDGISTSGPVPFYIGYAYTQNVKFKFGNVVVRGGSAARKAYFNSNSKFYVSGNLTIQDSGSVLDGSSTTFYLEGDIHVDSGATLKTSALAYFRGSKTQHITGKGVYWQDNYKATFHRMFIEKTGGDLRFNIGDFSIGEEVVFDQGKIYTNGYTLTMLNNGKFTDAGQSTGWVVGPVSFQMVKYVSGDPYINTDIAVGDSLYYSGVVLNATRRDVISNGFVKVRVVNGDHPQINSSKILPSKSVNRYYIIDTLDGVKLNRAFTVDLNWNPALIDAGADYSKFILQSYSNSTWSSRFVTGVSVNGIQTAYLDHNIAGEYQVGAVDSAPAIIQHPANISVCSGENITFSVLADPVVSYQWQVYNGSTWTNIVDDTLYNGAHGATLYLYNVPASINNYQYRCRVYNAIDSATSNAATIVVGSGVKPVVTITSNKGSTICTNTSVTFTAAITNGGSTPVYKWLKNGNEVGSNNATYADNSLASNDVIKCVLKSSLGCASPDSAVSNSITMTVDTLVTPSVTISPNPNDTICAGTSVTFTATSVHGGSTPAYQWKLNGNNIGTNSPNYTNGSFNNNDIISCELTSNANCRTANTATATDTMIVDPLLTPAISISPNPNDTICAGTSVTYTATPVNGGSSPAYQWTVNGTNAGTGATYTSTGFSNNDIISCELTSSETCLASNNPVAKDTVVVNTQLPPSVTITVSPNDTICAGTSVTFTATPVNGGNAPAYQWTVNGTNTGTNSNTYTNTSLNNGDIVKCILTSSETCVTKAKDTSNAITMTVNAIVTPAVTISANPGNNICNGTSVTFTATPVNGGASPAYQWRVNNNNTGSNSSTYTNISLSNNDVIECFMTSNASCLSQTKDTSNSITMTVNPILTPSVTITVSPNDTICAGTPVTFTATPANGGSSPAYQWRVNGSNVGTNSTTYTTTGLTNNNVVDCILSSSVTCVSKPKDTSNAITMIVNPVLTPTITISANPGNTICAGTSVTFTAATTNGGSGAAYQWKLNNNNVGTNSNTYTNSGLSNGDVITCVLTSNATCANPTTVTATSITMTVNPMLTPSVTTSVSPNDTICAGTSVTFTATQLNGGSNPAYQWKLNNNNVGTNNSTYTNTGLSNGDVITCELTSNATCLTSSTATSGAITMTVNPVLTPTISLAISPNDTICAGTSVTFTATTTNGGASPVYQWKRNTANVGTNANTYTNATLSNGDIITCELTSNATCVNPASVTATGITMTVHPVLTPSVSINTNLPTTGGPWRQITFTASPVNGGNSPSYQWKRNAINIPGATNSTYQGTTNIDLSENDVICVLLTSSVECPSPDTASGCAPAIHINVGTDNIGQPGDLVLFPNPNDGNFTIRENMHNNVPVDIDIVNMYGQVIYKYTLQPKNGVVNYQLNLKGLAAGVYTLRIITADERQEISFIIK